MGVIGLYVEIFPSRVRKCIKPHRSYRIANGYDLALLISCDSCYLLAMAVVLLNVLQSLAMLQTFVHPLYLKFDCLKIRNVFGLNLE